MDIYNNLQFPKSVSLVFFKNILDQADKSKTQKKLAKLYKTKWKKISSGKQEKISPISSYEIIKHFVPFKFFPRAKDSSNNNLFIPNALFGRILIEMLKEKHKVRLRTIKNRIKRNYLFALRKFHKHKRFQKTWILLKQILMEEFKKKSLKELEQRKMMQAAAHLCEIINLLEKRKLFNQENYLKVLRSHFNIAYIAHSLDELDKVNFLDQGSFNTTINETFDQQHSFEETDAEALAFNSYSPLFNTQTATHLYIIISHLEKRELFNQENYLKLIQSGFSFAHIAKALDLLDKSNLLSQENFNVIINKTFGQQNSSEGINAGNLALNTYSPLFKAHIIHDLHPAGFPPSEFNSLLKLIFQHNDPSKLAFAFAELQMAGLLNKRWKNRLTNHFQPDHLAEIAYILGTTKLLDKENVQKILVHKELKTLSGIFLSLSQEKLLTASNVKLILRQQYVTSIFQKLNLLRKENKLNQSSFLSLFSPKEKQPNRKINPFLYNQNYSFFKKGPPPPSLKMKHPRYQNSTI